MPPGAAVAQHKDGRPAQASLGNTGTDFGTDLGIDLCSSRLDVRQDRGQLFQTVRNAAAHLEMGAADQHRADRLGVAKKKITKKGRLTRGNPLCIEPRQQATTASEPFPPPQRAPTGRSREYDGGP